ncbi:MAG: zf-TFIIB domain-containing protein [Polyangiaceae bacterium]
MRCVKCSGTMVGLEVGKVHVDRCDKCHGIWFDRRELTEVLGSYRQGEAIPLSVPNPVSKEVEEKLGVCPRCDVALAREDTMAVEGLHWDTCKTCGGAWLDGGELLQIAADPEAAATAAFFAKGH